MQVRPEATAGRDALAAPLDVPSAIRKRRTIRHYTWEPIPQQILDELAGLALEAPSSWNLQDRSIVIVQSEAGLEGLTWATGGQPQPQEAPVIFVFVAYPRRWRQDQSAIYGQARAAGAWNDDFISSFSDAMPDFQRALEARGLEREYAIKDAMIAASFLVLAAESLGLATSFMNGWDEDRVKQVIGLRDDDTVAVAVLVAVGYPAEERINPGRRPLAEHVFVERARRLELLLEG